LGWKGRVLKEENALEEEEDKGFPERRERMA